MREVPNATVTIGTTTGSPSGSCEPTPELAAMIAEEFRRLLERLGDDQLRRIALERMEGYTSDEIAERLGCARWTVARRLDLIRQLWTEESESEPSRHVPRSVRYRPAVL